MAEPGAVMRVEVAGRTLALTSLDKLLYPATETTKSEILHYYACVGPILLRHLRNRPVTRVRWPHGVEGPSFFEKNLPSGAPTWLPRVRIDDVTYPLIADLADLTYLANLNSLEFHVPQWRITPDGVRGNPNRLVIDLDPGKPAGLRECAQVALHVRERLSALGLAVVPVTSGSKGMQLYAPLGGDLTSDQVRDLAQRLAAELTTRFPKAAAAFARLRAGERPATFNRRQDHDLPLLPTRPRHPHRRVPANLGRDRAGSNGEGRPRTGDVRGRPCPT